MYTVLYTALYTVLYTKLYPDIKALGWDDLFLLGTPPRCPLVISPILCTKDCIFHCTVCYIVHCTVHCALHVSFYKRQVTGWTGWIPVADFPSCLYYIVAEHYNMHWTVYCTVHCTVHCNIYCTVHCTGHFIVNFTVNSLDALYSTLYCKP